MRHPRQRSKVLLPAIPAPTIQDAQRSLRYQRHQLPLHVILVQKIPGVQILPQSITPHCVTLVLVIPTAQILSHLLSHLLAPILHHPLTQFQRHRRIPRNAILVLPILGARLKPLSHHLDQLLQLFVSQDQKTRRATFTMCHPRQPELFLRVLQVLTVRVVQKQSLSHQQRKPHLNHHPLPHVTLDPITPDAQL